MILSHETNFIIVALIMERFRRISPEAFIDNAFPDDKDDLRLKADLLKRYVGHCNENVWEFFLLCSADYQYRIHVYLNNLVTKEERDNLVANYMPVAIALS